MCACALIPQRQSKYLCALILITLAADLDYSLPQLQFIFNVTTTNSCLVIEVTDDSAFELSEQFTLQLDTSFTFVLLSPDTATVHITDNDCKLTGCPLTYSADIVTRNHVFVTSM